MKQLQDLIIYQKAIKLVKSIYSTINIQPKLKNDFSLSDQLKRASVSVAANIAEGYFRSKKQTRNYLEIASGSTNEMLTLLTIVTEVYCIDTTQLQNEYIILGKQINSFSNSID